MVVPFVSTTAGPANAVAGLEQVAVVDRGRVDALGREVHLAPPFERVCRAFVPYVGSALGRELADLGDRDEVAADELDRRVETVGVLALVRLVERRPRSPRRRRVDMPSGSAISTPCSWFV